ncbi:aldo/keto reductase [Isoptericola sp. NPDC060257]|uniref:aldo/keto reductase n=1 Tax=Isoptericola sp. NPDC060257 TaxID=3347087 RepID=UPI003657B4EF
MTTTVTLPDGRAVPALGQGTWFLGETPSRRADELAALRTGLDLGLTLIDTAEMYGEGAAEELVGEAVAGRRDDVVLVSKVYPWNADARGTVEACRASLRRLGTDRLDLYLLHWRGGVPLAETAAALDALVQAGDVLGWGVSNLDVDDLRELDDVAGGLGSACQTDQVLYNLSRRGPEHDLLPFLRERGVATMAYSPVEQGRILGDPALRKVARRHGATPAQVALAWVLAGEGVVAIPRSGSAAHVRENAAARDLRLGAEDLAELDAAFPPPSGPVPLDML